MTVMDKNQNREIDREEFYHYYKPWFLLSIIWNDYTLRKSIKVSINESKWLPINWSVSNNAIILKITL